MGTAAVAEQQGHTASEQRTREQRRRPCEGVADIVAGLREVLAAGVLAVIRALSAVAAAVVALAIAVIASRRFGVVLVVAVPVSRRLGAVLVVIIATSRRLSTIRGGIPYWSDPDTLYRQVSHCR